MGTGENLLLGLAATAFLAVHTIKLSDWTAPEVKRETGLTGIAISPLSSTGLLPYAVGINLLIDRIPGLRNLSYNPHKEGTGVKVLGEPMVVGVIVGMLPGLAANVILEHRSILSAGLILMPISLAIALVLPGNKMLPLGGYLLIASRLAPLITRLSKTVGTEIPGGLQITAFTDGGHPVRFWVINLFSGNIIAFCPIPVIGLLFYLSYRRYKQVLREHEA